MRTTLSLDDDVAAQLERLRHARSASLGLRDMTTPPRKRKAFRTRSFRMGKPLINIDNIAETLAYLEGEGFR
jgi:hypothetical protein